MKILVIGGTRFFGVHTVNALLAQGHDVTIATRGNAPDPYGKAVKRIILERTSETSMKNALGGRHYDVVIDKIAYCSNDIKYAMEALDCDKYIYMSSTAVYDPLHRDTVESDFDGVSGKPVWCDRGDFSYGEVKRQAEYALWQKYAGRNWIAVRYPFVVGKDDYTKRLLFYVEHTVKSIPMHIDNPDRQMGLICSEEAGRFMAYLVDQDLRGAVNGSAEGTISIREILAYVEKKTGAKAVMDAAGESAPYNGTPEYSIHTEKAKALGFRFSALGDWIFALIDHYIRSIA